MPAKPIPITKLVNPGTPLGGTSPATPAAARDPVGKSTPGPPPAGNGFMFTQPAFDARISTITMPFGLNTEYGRALTRGRMIWDKAVTPYKQPAQINFLYNPSTISLTYSQSNTPANSDIQDASSVLAFANKGDQGAAICPMQQTLSFTLLYDRTYELWGSYNMSTGLPNSQTQGNGAFTDATQAGVGADLICMQQFTGQFMSEPTGGGKGNGSIGAASGSANNFVMQGPMIFIPTWVYFGSVAPSNFFYGYITDYEVQITHWTQMMVPMRCVIGVNFALLPPPGTDATSGPGSNFWWVKSPIAGGVGPGTKGTANPGGPAQLKPTPPTKGVSGR
jgi:hypothetical protein